MMQKTFSLGAAWWKVAGEQQKQVEAGLKRTCEQYLFCHAKEVPPNAWTTSGGRTTFAMVCSDKQHLTG